MVGCKCQWDKRVVVQSKAILTDAVEYANPLVIVVLEAVVETAVLSTTEGVEMGATVALAMTTEVDAAAEVVGVAEPAAELEETAPATGVIDRPHWLPATARVLP